MEPERASSTLVALTGPLAAVVHLTAVFVLAPTARDLGSKALLYAISGLMLAVTAAAAAACERQRRHARAPDPMPQDDRGSRARFVGLGGLLLNLSALLVIAAQTVPIVMLELGD